MGEIAYFISQKRVHTSDSVHRTDIYPTPVASLQKSSLVDRPVSVTASSTGYKTGASERELHTCGSYPPFRGLLRLGTQKMTRTAPKIRD